MPIRNGMPPRASRGARERPSPQALANAFTEALFWRARWRAQIAGCADGSSEEQPARNRLARTQFAAAMARAELGRFHWDARREVELRGAKRNGSDGRTQ